MKSKILGLWPMVKVRMRSEKALVALLSVGLLVATVPAGATPLTDIDEIGSRTGFILWVPSEAPSAISMTHDAALGRSTYLQEGAWDYTPWFDSVDPPIYAGFEGIFAWTAGIAPDGEVTDSGSMLFIGDLGSGLEPLIGGHLLRVGVMGQGPSEWGEGNFFWGLQYLFALSFLDSRLSALGNAFRFDFPTNIFSIHDSPFYEDFRNPDLWSDPGLIGLTIPEPGSLALLGLGLAGLGLSRRRNEA